jgi:hypothetical protein
MHTIDYWYRHIRRLGLHDSASLCHILVLSAHPYHVLQSRPVQHYNEPPARPCHLHCFSYGQHLDVHKEQASASRLITTRLKGIYNLGSDSHRARDSHKRLLYLNLRRHHERLL